MTVAVRIVGSSDVMLWHLDSRTRLARQIAQEPSLCLLPDDDAAAIPALLAHADFLFEGATLRELAARGAQTGALLIDPSSARVAAIALPQDSSALSEAQAITLLDAAAPIDTPWPCLTPEDIPVYDGKLRRHSVPTLARLAPEHADALEAQLYGASYKGITDLVTKWWWPRPAKRGVAWCAARDITPNQVTGLGAVLMLFALAAFALGAWLPGLLAGWFMTYLDTVDGKLARVRVQSSPMGHALDHGMDIVHPPFWYLAWAYGLSADTALWQTVPFEPLMIAMFAGYVGGRIAEGLFHALGSCSLFAWRPFDAYFRLITGRRNPCLILLTVGVAIGRPDLGLLWVVAWTVLSTVILFLRLLYALAVRLRSGPLTSWLADGEQAAARYPSAYRTFAKTQAAYNGASANA
ncbi:MAG: CDP-alcohol phosphatidyltransferase family protein [Pseudomonadota bacterium]